MKTPFYDSTKGVVSEHSVEREYHTEDGYGKQEYDCDDRSYKDHAEFNDELHRKRRRSTTGYSNAEHCYDNKAYGNSKWVNSKVEHATNQYNNTQYYDDDADDNNEDSVQQYKDTYRANCKNKHQGYKNKNRSHYKSFKHSYNSNNNKSNHNNNNNLYTKPCTLNQTYPTTFKVKNYKKYNKSSNSNTNNNYNNNHNNHFNKLKPITRPKLNRRLPEIQAVWPVDVPADEEEEDFEYTYTETKTRHTSSKGSKTKSVSKSKSKTVKRSYVDSELEEGELCDDEEILNLLDAPRKRKRHSVGNLKCKRKLSFDCDPKRSRIVHDSIIEHDIDREESGISKGSYKDLDADFSHVDGLF